MSNVNIRPLGDRILVMRSQQEEMSKGGIVIPDTAKEKPIEGEVLAVGSGKPLDNGTTRAVTVKVGEKVLFGKYAGTEVKHRDQDYLILREEDILGVVQA